MVIIRYCPFSAKAVQLSLGAFVLFTGLLAFVSGSYAISNMFITEDANHLPVMAMYGWIVSCLLGLLYASMIVAIDREIVAATTKWAVLARIPLAIVISLVVSIPIELQIFEGKILTKMLTTGREERNLFEKDFEQRTIIPIRSRLIFLETKMQEAIESRNEYDEAARDEAIGAVKNGRTGRKGTGVAYKENIRNAENQTELIGQYAAEIKVLKSDLNNAEERLKTEKKAENIPVAFDLLSKYTVLKQLKADDETGSISEMSWGITLLFLLFEIIPSVMKLLLPKTEYDNLLEKRRLLNIYSAKIIYQHTYLDYGGMDTEEIQTANPKAVHKMFRSQSTSSALE